jgi:hypothetical protein
VISELLDLILGDTRKWLIRTIGKPHADGFNEADLILADRLALAYCDSAIAARERSAESLECHEMTFRIGEKMFLAVDVLTHTQEWFDLYHRSKRLGEDIWQLELGGVLLRREATCDQIALDVLEFDPSKQLEKKDSLLEYIIEDESWVPISSDVKARVVQAFRNDPLIIGQRQNRDRAMDFLNNNRTPNPEVIKKFYPERPEALMQDLIGPMHWRTHKWATNMTDEARNQCSEPERDLADRLAHSICQTAVDSRKKGGSLKEAQNAIFRIGELIFATAAVTDHAHEWFEVYEQVKQMGDDDWQASLGFVLVRQEQFCDQIVQDAIECAPSTDFRNRKDHILGCVICKKNSVPVSSHVRDRVVEAFEADPRLIGEEAIRDDSLAFLDISD